MAQKMMNSNPFAVLGQKKPGKILVEQKFKPSVDHSTTNRREQNVPRAVAVTHEPKGEPLTGEGTAKLAASKNKKDAKMQAVADKVIAKSEKTKTEEHKKEQEKAQKKEEQKEAKVEKIIKDQTDRHDRSGKAQRVRKEGKGVAGWDESKPIIEDAVATEEAPNWGDAGEATTPAAETTEAPAAEGGAVPAAEAEAPKLSPEEIKRREEEAKAREEEEKQMTLDEYMAKHKPKHIGKNFKIRKVEKVTPANMVLQKPKGNEVIVVKAPKKEQPAPKVEASPKPEAKKAEAKKPELKKAALGDFGFRMDNPALRSERGRGRGRGEGRGGRGRGRFGGGYSGGNNHDHAANQPVNTESVELFPALKPKEGSPTAPSNNNGGDSKPAADAAAAATPAN